MEALTFAAEPWCLPGQPAVSVISFCFRSCWPYTSYFLRYYYNLLEYFMKIKTSYLCFSLVMIDSKLFIKIRTHQVWINNGVFFLNLQDKNGLIIVNEILT